MKAIIDSEQCDGKFFCRPKHICHMHAIKINPNSAKGIKFIDKKLCVGCGMCLNFCDKKAIKMTEFYETEKD